MTNWPMCYAQLHCYNFVANILGKMETSDVGGCISLCRVTMAEDDGFRVWQKRQERMLRL